MTLRHPLRRLCLSLALSGAAAFGLASLPTPAATSEARRSDLVRAVERARASVVNLRGQKTVRDEGSGPREVNGMGTGVVIDERGYIITNCHVVEGVRQIEATLFDGRMFHARVVASDPKADLAIIKIDAGEKLPVIPIGTSRDLILAESVIAIGNAYGYEHTVTRGIISNINRTVTVSETQQYAGVIQTDAPINPGNSGGPLLNIDGDMIGVVVAVRAGANGIGFAIPVDTAMRAAAQLLSIERVDRNWHGVVVKDDASGGVVIEKIALESPAAIGDLQPGDRITSVGEVTLDRPLDLERAFLGREPGEKIAVVVERGGKPVNLSLALAAKTRRLPAVDERIWNSLGMKLASIDPRQVRDQLSKYRGGLKVVELKDDGPARKQGIRQGDILVGMHVWETVSLDNVEYILNRPEITQIVPVKFYIVRGGETLIGRLPITTAAR